MLFVTFVWKNVIHKPARSLLTVVGLAVAVAAVVSLVGISSGFERSFLDLYNQRGVDLVVIRPGGPDRLTSAVDDRFAERLRKLPGVRDVHAGLMDTVSFTDLPAVIVNGWSPDSSFLDELKLVDGRKIHPGDTTVVMLGKTLAANLGRKVGDKIEMYSEEFTVIGIYESFSVYENGMAVMPLEELQKLLDKPHQVTAFIVKTHKPGDKKELDEIRKQIKAIDPSLEAHPTEEFIRSVSQIQISRAVAWLTSGIALIIGAIGMLNTMVMSVFERTHEIGTLRAIGWHEWRVVRMILVESVLLSLGGAILGTVSAVLLTRFLSNLPATSGLIQGQIAPAVIVQGFLIALLVGIGGAAYPAYWGANLLPVEAMRRKM